MRTMVCLMSAIFSLLQRLKSFTRKKKIQPHLIFSEISFLLQFRTQNMCIYKLMGEEGTGYSKNKDVSKVFWFLTTFGYLVSVLS